MRNPFSSSVPRLGFAAALAALAFPAGAPAAPSMRIALRIDGGLPANPPCCTTAPIRLHPGIGDAVGAAGDANGDGRQDLVIGAPFEDNNGLGGSFEVTPARDAPGSAYVIFGPLEGSPLDLAAPGLRGFRVDGALRDQHLGASVAGAGDVNGDGLDDIVIGGPEVKGGRAYVVFGSPSPETVDLRRLGTRGFVITPPSHRTLDAFGSVVTGAGDVNRDGLADVAITKPGFEGSEGGGTPGLVAVVFGKRDTNAVSARALGRRGFLIKTRFRPEALAGAGDVNRDGLGDLVVGLPDYRLGGTRREVVNVGAAFVVFGSRSSATVTLLRFDRGDVVDAIGRRGFAIRGSTAGGRLGRGVAGAGDVNRDGLGDVLAGAPGTGFGPGAAYVVFGSRSSGTVRAGALGRRGYAMTAQPGSFAGFFVAKVDDVNGDRRPEAAVSYAGDAVVILGASKTSTVGLAAPGARGATFPARAIEPEACATAIGGAGVGALGGAPPLGAGTAPGVFYVGTPCASHQDRVGSGSVYAVTVSR